MAKLEQIGKIGSFTPKSSVVDKPQKIEFVKLGSSSTTISNIPNETSTPNHAESPINFPLNTYMPKVEESHDSHLYNDHLNSIDQDLNNESSGVNSKFFMESPDFKKLGNMMNAKFIKPHEPNSKFAIQKNFSKSTAIDKESKKIYLQHGYTKDNKSEVTSKGILSIPTSLNATSIRNVSLQHKSMSRITIEDLQMEQEGEEEEQDKFIAFENMEGNSE